MDARDEVEVTIRLPRPLSVVRRGRASQASSTRSLTMPHPVLDAPISPLRQRLIDDMTAPVQPGDAAQLSRRCRAPGDITSLWRSPDTATIDDLRRFQIEQQEDGVPVPTMNSIVAALRFLFTHTVGCGRRHELSSGGTRRPPPAVPVLRRTHDRHRDVRRWRQPRGQDHRCRQTRAPNVRFHPLASG